MVFCCFATVLLQATFLPTIFVAQNLASATLSRAFCCIGEQADNLTVSVWAFSGRRVLSCWRRLCVVFRNTIAAWQVVQWHVLCKTFAGTAFLYSFSRIFRQTVYVFLCAGGLPSVLEQALRCFSQRHCRLAGWAKACFPSKVCRRSVVFFVCGVFSRKMCCKRFLLMRFCTTLFALFHV